MFFQDGTIFADMDVALAAHQHQGSVGTEVSVPFRHLIVAPLRIVGLQTLVADSRKVGPEVDVSFIRGHAVDGFFQIDFVHGGSPKGSSRNKLCNLRSKLFLAGP